MTTPGFAPGLPPDEAERLASLRSLGILNTPPEERFDRITRLAARLFGTPIALVSIVEDDHQWFKSRQGIDATETPREVSFCAHAILGDEIMVVRDALDDPRFADHPYVEGEPKIRFYAGAPISAPDGAKLGTLCVVDMEPRELSREDRDALKDLAEMVEAEIATMDLAISDGLTGLVNRRGYESIGQQVIEVCKREVSPLAVCFIDLDNMKAINDQHGHDAGDAALKTIAGLLRSRFRASDVIARLGGDEFAVILTGTAADGAEVAVERFRAMLAEHNTTGGASYDLSVSIGVAVAGPDELSTLDPLTEAADKAMYAEKAAKKGSSAR